MRVPGRFGRQTFEALLETELRREAVVVPARPLLGDAAVLDAEDREACRLRLLAGLAVTSSQRQARRDLAVAADDVLDLVVEAVERLRLTLDARRDSAGVLVVGAGERMDMSCVVVREKVSDGIAIGVGPRGVVRAENVLGISVTAALD